MDLFVLLERMGEIAPVYDWCNHLDGYSQLKQAQALEYADTGGGSLRVRTKSSFSSFLEIDEDLEDREHEVLAWNPVESVSVPVNGHDLRAMRINREKLRILLTHILMPGAAKSQSTSSLYILPLFEDPAYVALLFPCSAQELGEIIKGLPADKTSIILTVSKSDVSPIALKEVLEHHPNVHLFHISEFIVFSQHKEEYIYNNPESFQTIIKNHLHTTKRGTLLDRPEGANWSDLEFVISSLDQSIEPDRILGGPKDEFILVKYDSPWDDYRVKCGVSAIDKFRGKKGQGSNSYIILRRFAKYPNKGIMTSSEQKDKTAMSRLRKLLCEMFGYNSFEDPIPNPKRNATLLKTAFRIRFSAGKSDPLAREMALVPLYEYDAIMAKQNQPTPRRGPRY